MVFQYVDTCGIVRGKITSLICRDRCYLFCFFNYLQMRVSCDVFFVDEMSEIAGFVLQKSAGEQWTGDIFQVQKC